VHQPLPTPSSIRILQLQPEEGTDIIQCQLLVVERDHALAYEAISYTWGRGTDTRVISCENQKLKVTVNLRDALWRIRDPTEVRLLWADAICINQHDNEERGFQVRQMPLIYANAERVLVWLDLPNSKFDDFEDLFNFDFEASATSPADKAGRASRILQEHVARLESSDVEREDSYPDTSIIANAFF
jgi:hypothetical protein